MNPITKPILLGILVGSIVTFLAMFTFYPAGNSISATSNTDDATPLYWVAPMDPNYRRDKPGKSPMGMDLVPVFKNAQSLSDNGPGTVTISPNVENNLGVRTTTAKYSSLQTEIKTVGYVTYDEDKLVHIHPRVEGWVEKLYIKSVGEPVTKNQALYAIYSPELVNAQEELLLALERKNERLISAAENRLTALQISKSSIENLKSSKQVQQTVTFFSPQNGVVENLKIREGFYVKPGSTLMSIADLSEVWVEAEVFERQSNQVKAGAAVLMKLDYLPGKTWRGVVDYIYPTLDVRTRTIKVRLRFNNDKGLLKPNMFAEITLHRNTHDTRLLIPKEALIRTGKQDRVVLAFGQGRFKSIEVVVGQFDNQHVEILDGLTAGDNIVSSAQFLLDSESSKSSDFKRMDSEKIPQASISRATTQGTINSIMVEHGMVNISRAAIAKWNRAAATVDFVAGKGVNFSGLTAGVQVSFTFEVHDDRFVIIEISPLIERDNGQSTSHEATVEHHSNH